jgi:hypothetical protein
LARTKAGGGLSGFSLLATTFAMESVWAEMMRMPGMPEGLDMATMGRVMSGVLAVVSAVVLTWAIANLAAGVGILGGRSWARILGMVVASIGGGLSLLWLAAMLWSWTLTAEMLRSTQFVEAYGRYGSPEMVGAGMAMTLLLVLPFVLGYVLVLVGLSVSGRFFSGRSGGAPTAS